MRKLNGPVKQCSKNDSRRGEDEDETEKERRHESAGIHKFRKLMSPKDAKKQCIRLDAD